MTLDIARAIAANPTDNLIEARNRAIEIMATEQWHPRWNAIVALYAEVTDELDRRHVSATLERAEMA